MNEEEFRWCYKCNKKLADNDKNKLCPNCGNPTKKISNHFNWILLLYWILPIIFILWFDKEFKTPIGEGPAGGYAFLFGRAPFLLLLFFIVCGYIAAGIFLTISTIKDYKISKNVKKILNGELVEYKKFFWCSTCKKKYDNVVENRICPNCKKLTKKVRNGINYISYIIGIILVIIGIIRIINFCVQLQSSYTTYVYTDHGFAYYSSYESFIILGLVFYSIILISGIITIIVSIINYKKNKKVLKEIEEVNNKH